jgi:lysophospholipase L1-like esterase
MKKIATILLALLLSACGGGGGGFACTPPSIQLFGDSTMAGAAPYWTEAFGDRIESRAAASTNTAQLIAGKDRKNQPWPRSVDSPYYVVNHGLNDPVARPGRPRVNVEQYKENLRVLAQAPGATAIFQTPNPSTFEKRDMEPYATAMKQVAREYGVRVIDVYSCFQRQPNWRDRIPDGLHPDERGYRFIVENCVAPVVEALPCDGGE